MMFIPMLAKATPTTVLLARGKSSKLEVKTENLKYFRAEAFENDSPCSRCQACRDKNVWQAMFMVPGLIAEHWVASKHRKATQTGGGEFEA